MSGFFKWFAFLILPLGAVVALYRYIEMRLQHSERFECITNSWCLEAPADLAALAILDGASVVLVGATLALAYMFTAHLARTGRLFITAGAMLIVLGLLGGLMFALHVPADEKLTMVHIPIVGAGLAAVGFALVMNTKEEKSK